MKDWEKLASDTQDRLAASLVTGKLCAYPAKLDGQDVVVLGFLQGPTDNGFGAVPLAICIDEAMMERLDIGVAQSAVPHESRAEAMLREFVEGEDSPCMLDHQGYCQEHMAWREDDEGRPYCGVAAARKLLGLPVPPS